MSNSKITPSAAKQDWAHAAEKAKEAAECLGAMASHFASSVGALASQAASDVGKKADDLSASAGVGIQGLGDRFGNSAPHSGVLGSASQAVANTVKQGGEYLENTKLSGMTDGAAQLIRRNPIPAVLIAIGLGWFASGKLRS